MKHKSQHNRTISDSERLIEDHIRAVACPVCAAKRLASCRYRGQGTHGGVSHTGRYYAAADAGLVGPDITYPGRRRA